MDKDRIAGSAKEIKGAVKQVAGKALGDEGSGREGRQDRRQGSQRHWRPQRHAQRQIAASTGDRSCRSDSILIIILVIFLLGGFSGRFGGYGYGYGHGGVGVIGIVVIILVVLLLMGRI